MDDEILKAMWPVFRAEAAEHVELLSAEVLKLELPPDQRPAGLMESISRTAHSLKGSAASLGFHDIEKVAHFIEDSLLSAQAGRVPLMPVDAILSGLQAIDAALGRGDAGQALTIPNLEGVLQRLTPTATAKAPPPRPTPAPAAPGGTATPPQAFAAELWPVFRAEIVEQLDLLRHALTDLEARGGRPDQAAEEIGRMCMAARHIHSSFAVIGVELLDRLALALDDALESVRFSDEVSRARLEDFLLAVDGLEEGVRDLDGSGTGLVVNLETLLMRLREGGRAGENETGEAKSVLDVFASEAEQELAALEEALTQLRSPFTPDRASVASDASRRAHGLKGSAAAIGMGQIAAAAKQLQEGFSSLQESSDGAPMVVVKLAGLLTELRSAVEALTRSRSEEQALPPALAEASAAPGVEAAKAEPVTAPGAAGRVTDRSIRVSEKTLDSLALQVEDLALSVGRQERRSKDLRALGGRVSETFQLLDQMASDLRTTGSDTPVTRLEESMARLRSLERDVSVMAADSSREVEHLRLVSTVVRNDLHDLRMMPASTLLEPMRRAVRDVASRIDKQVALKLTGGDVRLDRRILDELKDPLLHLVRNAIDHGLEAPAARVAAGKDATGSLEVRVEHRGPRVAVIVEDDGAGLSLSKIRATALKRKVLTEEEAAQLDDSETARLILRPGFSTADQVTAISGRGVGLDVVHETVNRLHGNIAIDFTPGRGARFTLELPLTLAAALALVVEVGRERVAIPSESVGRILRLKKSDLGTVAGRAVLHVGGAQLPFANLAQAVGLSQAAFQIVDHQPAVLLQARGQEMVLAVDDLIGHEEVVVQPLGRQLSRASHLSGAAVLDGGTVVGVLNVPEIVKLARPMMRAEEDRAKRRVLVADDSLTTRSAMKAVLEIAGYSVVVAKNGEEALSLLQETPCQLVVSDIQMPQLDGLGLTQRIRADPLWLTFPIILVTSLDSAEDRAAGLAAGADGYLIKREVERGKLLELVRQLLPG